MKRNHYFHGKLLSEHDFQVEQDYYLDKQRRLNLRLHIPGIVSGLQVSVGGSQDAGWRLHISPGLAIDELGNEIFVDAPQELALPQGASAATLVVSYSETLTDPVATGSGMQPSRVEEGFKFGFAAQGNSGNGGAIEVCRLRLVGGRWIVQPRHRSLLALGVVALISAILCKVFCHRLR